MAKIPTIQLQKINIVNRWTNGKKDTFTLHGGGYMVKR